MRRFIFLTLLLLLQACSEQVEIVTEQAPLVVQFTPVTEQQKNESYEFPAMVSAVKNVDLKFEVTGRLIETNLVKGKKVKKDEVLAQIDPTPYLRKVKEENVRHNIAIKDLNRIKTMFKKGAVSQSLLDNAESQFEITRLALAKAKQDLSYCKVTAPFDAFVSDRYIENNSYIRAGDSLATLQDRSALYFSFDVPERIMTTNINTTDFQATAKVIGLKDEKYTIHYVEHEATPDPITQTYNVTFAIDNSRDHKLIPGSRAVVTIITNADKEKKLIVPLSALTGNPKVGFDVWLFDEKFSTVKKRPVKVSALDGKFAIISEGLAKGDKVVSAATNKMRDTLVVKEYKAVQ